MQYYSRVAPKFIIMNETITTQFMLRFEAVLGLNLSKKILMLPIKNLLAPTTGKAILEHKHIHKIILQHK